MRQLINQHQPSVFFSKYVVWCLYGGPNPATLDVCKKEKKNGAQQDKREIENAKCEVCSLKETFLIWVPG